MSLAVWSWLDEAVFRIIQVGWIRSFKKGQVSGGISQAFPFPLSGSSRFSVFFLPNNSPIQADYCSCFEEGFDGNYCFLQTVFRIAHDWPARDMQKRSLGWCTAIAFTSFYHMRIEDGSQVSKYIYFLYRRVGMIGAPRFVGRARNTSTLLEIPLNLAWIADIYTWGSERHNDECNRLYHSCDACNRSLLSGGRLASENY